MVDKIMIFACIIAGLFIVMFCAHNAGIEMPFFTDKAEIIRAEAELKRVDVQMLKAVHDFEERKALIKAATEPRTHPLVIFCMIALAVLCGALFIALVIMFMRERERRRFAEYRMQISRSPKRKALSEPELPPGRFCIDNRDIERGAV